jgi:hypothetical protein
MLLTGAASLYRLSLATTSQNRLGEGASILTVAVAVEMIFLLLNSLGILLAWLGAFLGSRNEQREPAPGENPSG